MFREKATDPGGTKLGSNKKHYSTAQAVLNECTCKYDPEIAMRAQDSIAILSLTTKIKTTEKQRDAGSDMEEGNTKSYLRKSNLQESY